MTWLVESQAIWLVLSAALGFVTTALLMIKRADAPVAVEEAPEVIEQPIAPVTVEAPADAPWTVDARLADEAEMRRRRALLPEPEPEPALPSAPVAPVAAGAAEVTEPAPGKAKGRSKLGRKRSPAVQEAAPSPDTAPTPALPTPSPAP